jgi:hypothetical protein
MRLPRLLQSLTRSSSSLAAAAVVMSKITVSPSVEEEKKTVREKKAHWANDKGTLFRNPWDSFTRNPVGRRGDGTWSLADGGLRPDLTCCLSVMFGLHGCLLMISKLVCIQSTPTVGH